MLERFASSLLPDAVAAIRDGLIGKQATIDGPAGPKRLVYADYVASGRALRQVEDFIAAEVLPYYANSHSMASHCGAYMTRLRREARAAIAAMTHADDRYSVIFAGSGATAGLNRLVSLFGLSDGGAGERPAVLVGPYEHHSNILPWRESGAEIIAIEEAPGGGPDLAAIEAALAAIDPRRPRIGAFSALSNVTGIATDVDAVTRVLKRHGALAVWDYAGGGPYLPIRMSGPAGTDKDAVVISPHKFLGGPGASGILIVRNDAVVATRPTWPGGGTVSFVSAWETDYADDLRAREEAGTPNIIGDIRAALALLAKEAIGTDWIEARNQALTIRAREAWRANNRIELLGTPAATVPIFSFLIRDGEGAIVHPQLITRMLSDQYGIQARGGCSCAGPYAHKLLRIDRESSNRIRAAIRGGDELAKPGWTRLNLSYLLDDAEARFIITAVDRLAHDAVDLSRDYRADQTKAIFRHAASGDVAA